MAMASVAAFTLTTVVATSSHNTSSKGRPRVNYIGGLNSFEGLKAHNNVTSLVIPVCTNKSFALVLDSLRSRTPAKKGKRGGGGALSSTCNAVGEIFKIAAIMNGLVLVGVAVGFVLLRIEAAVEENE